MLINADEVGRSANFQKAATAHYSDDYNVQGFTPNSVEHPLTLSSNGDSQKDAGRRLMRGAILPSSNGMSADTYKKRQPLSSPYASVQ